MRRPTIILQILLLLCSIPVLSQDFYDINTINTIDITFTSSNWDQLLDDLVTEGLENRLMGTAVVNGVTFDSVGVRYKGNSTYSSTRTKNPFNIKLDYIIDNQEYGEYGTMKLANVYNDPSFVRETLSYEIARRYMPAPKANYIKVSVNGTYMGLYTSVQDVDKYFAKTHFYSKNNPFFKGDLAGGTAAMEVVDIWDYLGTDTLSYMDYYELESDEGWYELIGFLDTLNNYNSEVEEVLNVDRHIWMLAFDNLLVNLDSPINFGHNYYLYQDDNNRFNPIVWDFNESFGVFSRLLIDPMPMTTTDLQQLDPFLNESSSTYPIISKILSNDEYKKIYIAHMKTIIDDWFIDGTYETRANEIQAIIDTEVYNDPNKFYTYANFVSNVTSTVNAGGFPPQELVGITQLMDSRASYINSLPDFITTAPVITEVDAVSSGGSVTITALVTNETEVYVGYRSSEVDVFTKVAMYDDGVHNDGATDDNVYGVSIPFSSTSMQYYIYSLNSDAAALSPERAEYEFHTFTSAGDLVINEFMAKNETTVFDQNGEYDDWIELYNNTASDINLSGYYLSDNSDLPTKWAFPDTTITAGGYFIIWADEDELQGGLHANFKLSASGESILLVNSEQKTVDEVLFGAQTVDYTTGRGPNGTGDFILMEPTFNAENLYVNSINDQTENLIDNCTLAQNYPNPFNPVTTIKFSIQKADKVNLSVYNSCGQMVEKLIDSNLSQGNHSVKFNASGVNSGIYYYRLEAGNTSLTKKMLLIK
ncbi:MAG: CotH kinase family protein [Candidatus Delongbacteria bacterium]|nr:CotH kinase family protein [Candidatus Delongbacteria bacterium]